MSQPTTSPFADAIDGWILGSESFAGTIRSIVSPNSQEPTAVRVRRSPLPLSLVINATCEEFGISPSELRIKCSRHPARSVVAQLGREDSSATLQEIATALGLSRRDCVPKLLKKAQLAEPNSDIMRRMEATRRRLKCLMDSAILF